jgi:phage-related minor tail protein
MAKGGPVDANTPYIVGEQGPEMFVPTTAGKIIPNDQMGGSLGGGATNVTYNINAVDASSFRSMVARDPQFIYNITEVGRRSTPSRRTA